MQYSGELARIQQQASRTADYAARRAATLAALLPSPDEIILEVGCGSGLFTSMVAEAVGQLSSRGGIVRCEDLGSRVRLGGIFLEGRINISAAVEN